eukprot:2408769-Karenia_brevis.AAC.1
MNIPTQEEPSPLVLPAEDQRISGAPGVLPKFSQNIWGGASYLKGSQGGHGCIGASHDIQEAFVVSKDHLGGAFGRPETIGNTQVPAGGGHEGHREGDQGLPRTDCQVGGSQRRTMQGSRSQYRLLGRGRGSTEGSDGVDHLHHCPDSHPTHCNTLSHRNQHHKGHDRISEQQDLAELSDQTPRSSVCSGFRQDVYNTLAGGRGF